MAKDSEPTDGFEAQFLAGDELLHRVAGLADVNKILSDALERVGTAGDAFSRRVAVEALDRAKTVCKERL